MLDSCEIANEPGYDCDENGELDQCQYETVLQPNAVVQGNIDPAILIAGGDALRDAVSDLKAHLGGSGRHIANLGHGITPQTPPDHVAEMVALVRESV